jgi:predicted glycosyltransferase involved in capsule biosynthesis
MINEIIEVFYEENFLKLDGFDEALIGVDQNQMKLIYSVSKCLKKLEKRMTKEEAVEYFYFNLFNAYVGEKTPIFCFDNF